MPIYLEFSKKYQYFHYSGLVNQKRSTQINADYTWALLPIEDEATVLLFQVNHLYAYLQIFHM